MNRIPAKRGAVIGASFDAWMLDPGWKRAKAPRNVAGLEGTADHIDCICQLVGSARHCGPGVDPGGGFCSEQTSRDLDTDADIHKLKAPLLRRGYYGADIDAIFNGNCLPIFHEVMPERVPHSQGMTSRNS